ncbi:hypothetical protein GCM10025865_01770 [Paraoerskovia sediminicola]|uniref:TadE-like protein n=1 Tax=Paraoerskovia sediminicola TaxID=1138587 RepID=A0ABN6X9R6_9CELL|nr:pilus assembly protein [Paraoerskovia sediminicola]BDZ40878.1 hypothetical protein GCM10025865_01770 [Paraoerskovia sediminicola]
MRRERQHEHAGEAVAVNGAESGGALVEFLGATVLLLVPVVYLVVALARVQAGAFAVEAVARETARVVVSADTLDEARRQSEVVADLALADQGLPGEATITLQCSSVPCREPGSTVAVLVSYDVPLPLVPQGLGDRLPLQVPVEAVHVAAVDDHRVLGGGP